MTGASDDDQFAAFLASQPAAAPAPWRWELVLIAASTAMFAPTSTLRSLAWFVPSLPVGKALLGLRQSVERRRARELGLQRAGDLPRTLQRLPRMPLPLSALVDRARAPILLPPDPSPTGAILLLAASLADRRRRRGRGGGGRPGRWEDVLAYHITSAPLRRWDWRAAGGPM